MTRAATPKLGAYTALAGLGLLAAIVLGRPELVALAAPFAAVLVVGLSLAEAPDVEVDARARPRAPARRARVVAELELRAEHRSSRLELLSTFRGHGGREGEPCWSRSGRRARARRSTSRSAAALGRVPRRQARPPLTGPLGLLVFEWTLEPELRAGLPARREPGGCSAARDAAVRRQPGRREQAARGSSSPTSGRSSPATACDGSTGARPHGAGETGSTRPIRSGTPTSSSSSTPSSRRGLDDAGTLDLTDQRCASLVARLPQAPDRVGLVAFGGVVNWLAASRADPALPDPRLAARHRDLLATRGRTSTCCPCGRFRRTRSCSPCRRCSTTGVSARCSTCAPAASTSRSSRSRPSRTPRPARRADGDLAHRLWQLRRETLRSRYMRLGVPVVEWREGVPLELALEEVRSFRRHARLSHV